MAEILKQNVGNKILRQNQGGKILKANYNFGKSIQNFIIEIPSLAGTDMVGYSIELWRSSGASLRGAIGMVSGTKYLRTDFNTNDLRLLDLGSMISAQLVSGLGIYNGSIAYHYCHLGGIGVDLKKVDNKSFYAVPDKYFISGNTLDHFYIGHTSSTNPSTFARKVGLYRIYNRILTENEYTHNYNKQLGGEPLSTLGLEYEFLMNKAEILDFSVAQDGSDMRVGVRNFGSIVNGHGEIIGLPAGTLQEKVDYANANLFVNFL